MFFVLRCIFPYYLFLYMIYNRKLLNTFFYHIGFWLWFHGFYAPCSVPLSMQKTSVLLGLRKWSHRCECTASVRILQKKPAKILSKTDTSMSYAYPNIWKCANCSQGGWTLKYRSEKWFVWTRWQVSEPSNFSVQARHVTCFLNLDVPFSTISTY